MCLLSWVAASVNVAHGQQAAGQIRDPVYAGHMMAGVEGMRTGDFVAAMREFRGALDARPNDFRALVQLGRAQLGGNDLQGASQTYATLKVGFPDLPAGSFGLGQVEMARNNPEAAQLALQEALQLDPDHYGANFYFARALQAVGDVTGAAAAYQARDRDQSDGSPGAARAGQPRPRDRRRKRGGRPVAPAPARLAR